MPRRPGLPCMALGLMLAAACIPTPPTPGDFPPPPTTPIVEFPTMLPPTATPRPITKPILVDDMSAARTLFLILQIGMSAGDSISIAERVLYPIRVRVNGQPTVISSAADFERNYEGIFNKQLQQTIADADENDLELGLDGIKAAGGALWFNRFCTDAACTQGEFLITHINN